MRRILPRIALLLVCLCAFVLTSFALISSAKGQEPAASPRAERIRADLRQILSAPEFRVTPAGETPLQRAGRWLRERWDAFVKWWEGLFSFGGQANPGASRFFMWIVLGVLIVGIAYVLAYAVRRGALARGLKSGRSAGVNSSSEPIEERIDDPDGLLAAAKELAVAGQYRRAYRAVFLAILLRMDRLELIRFDRSRTNGEYLRALRSRPDVLNWMRPLTNDFDLRWYGGQPVDEPDYRRAMTVYERITAPKSS
jgi:hypothetical protein